MTIFICGNGGSSAQADHFAAELIGDGIPCISLNNPAVLTAIANDHDYRLVFSAQLDALAQRGDLVILLSTSCRSQNIKWANLMASYIGCTTVLITGEHHLTFIRLFKGAAIPCQIIGCAFWVPCLALVRNQKDSLNGQSKPQEPGDRYARDRP